MTYNLTDAELELIRILDSIDVGAPLTAADAETLGAHYDAVVDELSEAHLFLDSKNVARQVESADGKSFPAMCLADRIDRLLCGVRDDVVERLRELAAGFLPSLKECWTFSDQQQHTHSWHDMLDFVEKWKAKIGEALNNG